MAAQNKPYCLTTEKLFFTNNFRMYTGKICQCSTVLENLTKI